MYKMHMCIKLYSTQCTLNTIGSTKYALNFISSALYKLPNIDQTFCILHKMHEHFIF